MLIADSLSRRPDYKIGVKLDNNNKILLKPKYFAVKALGIDYEALFDNTNILDTVKKVLQNNEIIKNYKQLLKSDPHKFNKSLQDWNFENGLLLYCRKVYIPKDENLNLK